MAQQTVEIAQVEDIDPLEEAKDKKEDAEAEGKGDLRPLTQEELKTRDRSCPNCIKPGQKGPLDPDHAKNFDWYLPVKLAKPATYYRFWGGRAGVEGRDGTYYSLFPPNGASESAIRDKFSLPSQWNSMKNVNTVTIPAGTTVYVGPASAQGIYNGGGIQVYVPR